MTTFIGQVDWMTSQFSSVKSLSESLGDATYSLIRTLYPLRRSITGDGVHKNLSIANKVIDIDLHEVPSGKQIFDRQVPHEGIIRVECNSRSGLAEAFYCPKRVLF